MSSLQRVLIVEPDGSFFSNPTLLAILKELERRGVGVDIVAPVNLYGALEHPEASPGIIPYDSTYAAKFQWRMLPFQIGKHFVTHGGLQPRIKALLKAGHYRAILGVDPRGIGIAHMLNRFAKRPLGYISFELLLSYEVESPDEQLLKRREREASKDCALVLIQDAERRDMLCRDNGIDVGICTLVPVAPIDVRPARTGYLREEFNLDEDVIIVLYQGALWGWSGRDEFEEMVSYWPDNYRLVIHQNRRPQARMAAFLKGLEGTGRILVTREPLPERLLPELTASADIGLASYRPGPDQWEHADNMRYMGLASGKLSYYAMCGVPVIARMLPSLDALFERYGFGKSYSRLDQTPSLLAEMIRSRQQMSSAARSFYEQVLCPDGPVSEFCDRLLEL